MPTTNIPPVLSPEPVTVTQTVGAAPALRGQLMRIDVPGDPNNGTAWRSLQLGSEANASLPGFGEDAVGVMHINSPSGGLLLWVSMVAGGAGSSPGGPAGGGGDVFFGYKWLDNGDYPYRIGHMGFGTNGGNESDATHVGPAAGGDSEFAGITLRGGTVGGPDGANAQTYHLAPPGFDGAGQPFGRAGARAVGNDFNGAPAGSGNAGGIGLLKVWWKESPTLDPKPASPQPSGQFVNVAGEWKELGPVAADVGSPGSWGALSDRGSPSPAVRVVAGGDYGKALTVAPVGPVGTENARYGMALWKHWAVSAAASVEALALIELTGWADVVGAGFGICLFGKDASNYILAGGFHTESGKAYWPPGGNPGTSIGPGTARWGVKAGAIDQNAAGLLTGVTYAPGTKWWVRARWDVAGTLSRKVWADGTEEPGWAGQSSVGVASIPAGTSFAGVFGSVEAPIKVHYFAVGSDPVPMPADFAYVNVSGVWKPIVEGWVNAAGEWKPLWPIIPPAPPPVPWAEVEPDVWVNDMSFYTEPSVNAIPGFKEFRTQAGLGTIDYGVKAGGAVTTHCLYHRTKIGDNRKYISTTEPTRGGAGTGINEQLYLIRATGLAQSSGTQALGMVLGGPEDEASASWTRRGATLGMGSGSTIRRVYTHAEGALYYVPGDDATQWTDGELWWIRIRYNPDTGEVLYRKWWKFGTPESSAVGSPSPTHTMAEGGRPMLYATSTSNSEYEIHYHAYAVNGKVCPLPPPPPIVPNGDFSTPDISAWTVGAAGGTLSHDPVEGATSPGSLKIVMATEQTSANVNHAIVAGQTVTYAFKIKTASAGTGTHFPAGQVQVQVSWTGGTPVHTRLIDITPGTWLAVEGTAVAPAGSTAMRLRVSPGLPAGGEVWLDDVRVTIA